MQTQETRTIKSLNNNNNERKLMYQLSDYTNSYKGICEVM